MSILGKIFTKPIDVNKAIDFVAKSADNLNFTNQERAKLNAELAENLAKHVEATVDESTDRSVTRRYIAVVIITLYVCIAVAVLLLYAFGVDAVAKQIVEITNVLELDTAFVMILAFFFGGYYINKLDFKGKK